MLHTLRSQIQSKPIAARRSRSASGTSSSVAGRPSVCDNRVSQTRVLIWKSDGYCGRVIGRSTTAFVCASGVDFMLHLHRRGQLAKLHDLLWSRRGEQVRHAGDDAGPTRLMTGAQTGAVVTNRR